jgi:pilus assembly protein CpaF
MESKVIPIFSNKGGVGKTFIAVNLATALALSGRKVLLLDLDFQAGLDMARMLNLIPQQSLVQFLTEIRKSDNPNLDILKKFVISHSCGLDFLPAITHAHQISSLNSEDIKLFLKMVTQSYDYIIVDAGYAFSEMMLTILDNSNIILLAATPDILAVYQLRWCLKILGDMHFPSKMVKLILNRAESQGGVPWQEVRDALGIDVIGRIPSDGKGVGLALEHGVPSIIDSPKSHVAEAFRKIASEFKKEGLFFQTSGIERKHEATDKFEEPSGFWKQFEAIQGTEDAAQRDELVTLKRKIHAKLITQLNLASLTPEHFTDPEKALELRESAKKIVSALLLEEKGAIISSHEERLRTVNDIVNEILGLGVLEEIMEDPGVSDIMVNGHQEIYIEKEGQMLLTQSRFVSEEQLRAIINRIIAPLGRRIDESVPMVDARLPDGSRFHAIIPPLCLTGPTVTIRKFGAEKLTVDDIVHRFHSLSEAMRDFLYACVLGRMNIIISGGTGSGKTTLLNVLSEFVPDGERIITIEDAAELRLKKEHWCRLESRPPNVEGVGEITVRDLFVNSLRMRPDRIVVGECRGPEVLDMLQAMNTGHDGSMTTLHANSTRDVLVRMSSLILLSGIELPMRAINEMISSAINVIVHMSRFTDGSRKITGVSEVAGISEQHELILNDIFQFQQTGRDSTGKVQGFYQSCAYVPKCADALITKGITLNKDIFHSPPVPV